MRRGEIAISVIILIALGLLVLTILAAMLVTSGERARETTGACEDTYGGVCTTKTACINTGGRIVGGVTCNKELSTEYESGWVIEQFPSGGAACCVR